MWFKWALHLFFLPLNLFLLLYTHKSVPEKGTGIRRWPATLAYNMNFFYIFLLHSASRNFHKKRVYCAECVYMLEEDWMKIILFSSITMLASQKRASRDESSHIHQSPRPTTRKREREKDVNNFYCKNLLMKLFKTTHTLFISTVLSSVSLYLNQQIFFSYTQWKWYSFNFNDFNFSFFLFQLSLDVYITSIERLLLLLSFTHQQSFISFFRKFSQE